MGLHECAKLARSGRIRLLFLAADLERVPGERGLDALVAATLAHCRLHAAPVVFLPSRYALGASACASACASRLFSCCPTLASPRLFSPSPPPTPSCIRAHLRTTRPFLVLRSPPRPASVPQASVHVNTRISPRSYYVTQQRALPSASTNHIDSLRDRPIAVDRSLAAPIEIPYRSLLRIVRYVYSFCSCAHTTGPKAPAAASAAAADLQLRVAVALASCRVTCRGAFAFEMRTWRARLCFVIIVQ